MFENTAFYALYKCNFYAKFRDYYSIKNFLNIHNHLEFYQTQLSSSEPGNTSILIYGKHANEEFHFSGTLIYNFLYSLFLGNIAFTVFWTNFFHLDALIGISTGNKSYNSEKLPFSIFLKTFSLSLFSNAA